MKTPRRRRKSLTQGQMCQQPPGWYGLTQFTASTRTGPDGRPLRRARLWCQDYDPDALKEGRRRVVLRQVQRLAPTDQEANEAIEKFKDELRKRFPSGQAVAERRTCTVAEAVKTYLKVQVEGVLAPRSQTVYACTANAVIKALGDLSLENLNAEIIREALWEKGRKRSKERIELLGRAIQYAIDNRAWTSTHNPVEGVPPVMKGKRTHTIDRGVIDSAKIAKLFAHVATDPQWLAFYFLAAFAGPRASELLDAEITDYDPKEGTLHVGIKTEASDRKIVLGRTGRALVERLIRHHAVRGYKGPWLFPSERGKHLLHSGFSKTVFKPTMLQAGLAVEIAPGPAINNPDRLRKHGGIDPDFTMHEFRHTASTRDRDVMPPLFLDAQLGHKNATRLADPNAAAMNYAHAQDPSLFPKRREYAEIVDGRVKCLLAKPGHLAVAQAAGAAAGAAS